MDCPQLYPYSAAVDNLYSILRFNESGTDRINYVFSHRSRIWRICLSS